MTARKSLETPPFVLMVAIIVALGIGFISGSLLTQKNIESASQPTESIRQTSATAKFQGPMGELVPDEMTKHLNMSNPDITYDNAGQLRWKTGTDDPEGTVFINVYYYVNDTGYPEISEDQFLPEKRVNQNTFSKTGQYNISELLSEVQMDPMLVPERDITIEVRIDAKVKVME